MFSPSPRRSRRCPAVQSPRRRGARRGLQRLLRPEPARRRPRIWAAASVGQRWVHRALVVGSVGVAEENSLVLHIQRGVPKLESVRWINVTLEAGPVVEPAGRIRIEPPVRNGVKTVEPARTCRLGSEREQKGARAPKVHRWSDQSRPQPRQQRRANELYTY